jgi:FkbM family methyltransferase
MKRIINNLLSPLNVELHGKGYIKKISKGEFRSDAFVIQKEILPHPHTIFDVGSNRGTITAKYLSMYNDANIFAFDPIEHFSKEYLKFGSKVKFHNLAFSDVKGMFEFNINQSVDTSSLLSSTKIGANSDDKCSTVNQIKISTTTIDAFCEENNLKNIDILKLDVQGSELAILKGAEKLLNTKRIKLIYTEAYFKQQYLSQPLFYEIGGYLKEQGYYLADIFNPYYNGRELLWCDAIFVN